ncbi:MAG: hypothetical protein P4L43_04455 [Syntrophobacteraceae bacterium]|nr:hypothetical protein [Syntrophobacteraceae bacterium]
MKTIVWDVDDVLNDLMGAWLADWTKANTASRPLPYEGLSTNPAHELLGISRAEYLESLDTFRLCGKAAKLTPQPEVYEWFARFGNTCRNVALTAVPLSAAHVSADWVMRNFGKWIRSYNVAPSSRAGDGEEILGETKSEFLLWWGKADVLVDDSEENVAGARALGMAAVLFPRPWNRSLLTIEDALDELSKLAGLT